MLTNRKELQLREYMDLGAGFPEGHQHAFVHCDGTRVTGLPEKHQRHDLILKFAWRYQMPFVCGADAIETTLSFDGVPHNLVIPWACIWAVSMPALGEVTQWPHARTEAVEPPKAATPRPFLRIVAEEPRETDKGGAA